MCVWSLRCLLFDILGSERRLEVVLFQENELDERLCVWILHQLFLAVLIVEVVELVENVFEGYALIEKHVVGLCSIGGQLECQAKVVSRIVMIPLRIND